MQVRSLDTSNWEGSRENSAYAGFPRVAGCGASFQLAESFGQVENLPHVLQPTYSGGRFNSRSKVQLCAGPRIVTFGESCRSARHGSEISISSRHSVWRI